MAIKLELDQDQLDTVQFALDSPYSIIALEMGLGKSACAIAIKDSIKDSRCLVICPAYLTGNWINEINKTLDGQLISRFKKTKDVYYPVDSDFVIVSYDTAIKCEFLFEWANMVILDEATAVKNMKAKRTLAIHKAIYENGIPRVHLLTGTPIKNRVTEFYSLMALCNYNPNSGDTSFLTEFTNAITFSDKFSHRTEFTRYYNFKSYTVVQWDGLKNEEELKKWLGGIYISRRSKMPPINFSDVMIDDCDDNELLKDFMESQGLNPNSVAPKSKVAAAIYKAPLTIEYVKDKIESGQIEGPVIIYTDHIEPCEILAKGFNTIPITGAMPPQKRQEMADAFQAGTLPVLVATIGSFSSGYTLTRGNYMCFNDFCWVPGEMEQCYFRINRKGQDRPCFVDRLFGSKQDEYIFNTQLNKYNVIKKFY